MARFIKTVTIKDTTDDIQDLERFYFDTIETSMDCHIFRVSGFDDGHAIFNVEFYFKNKHEKALRCSATARVPLSNTVLNGLKKGTPFIISKTVKEFISFKVYSGVTGISLSKCINYKK